MRRHLQKDGFVMEREAKLIARCVRLLHHRYGNKEKATSKPLLEQIIFYHLHRMVNITSARRALRSLRNNYIDYNEARIAKRQELGRVLSTANIPPEKTYILKEILRSVFHKENRTSLEHLKQLSEDKFRERLIRIDGVDEATLEYVTLCTFGKPLLPMSEEVRRVLGRYGLDCEKLDASSAAAYHNYYGKVDPYQAFCLLVEHSQKVCLADKPRCDNCVLSKDCSTARKKRALARRRRG